MLVNTKKEVMGTIELLWDTYEGQIEQAMAKSEKGVKVLFPVKIEPMKGGNKVEVGISFTKSKVADTQECGIVSEGD